MKKRMIAVVIMLSLILSCFTIVSFGASGTKKMTTYNVIKKKNTVYCAAHRGVFKVNLKTGSVKQLYNRDAISAAANGGTYSMKLYKGYVYFLEGGPMLNTLRRVKTKGGKAKKLADIPNSYAIKKNKIYYSGFNTKKGKLYDGVMKLSGKSKKKSKYKAKTTNKETNSPGYYINNVYEGELWYGDGYGNGEWHDTYTEYLVVKGGKPIKLCTYYTYW